MFVLQSVHLNFIGCKYLNVFKIFSSLDDNDSSKINICKNSCDGYLYLISYAVGGALDHQPAIRDLAAAFEIAVVRSP